MNLYCPASPCIIRKSLTKIRGSGEGIVLLRFTPLAHSRCSPAYFRLPFACGSDPCAGVQIKSNQLRDSLGQSPARQS